MTQTIMELKRGTADKRLCLGFVFSSNYLKLSTDRGSYFFSLFSFLLSIMTRINFTIKLISTIMNV